MAKIDKSIEFSFLPVLDESFSFDLYRKLVEQGDAREQYPSCHQDKMPGNNQEEYKKYWYSFESFEGATLFSYDGKYNPYVAINFLNYLLEKSCSENLEEQDFFLDEQSVVKRRRVFFVLQRHPEGQEVVWLEPFYLKSQGKLGYLLDFSFHETQENLDRRIIQQRSLSLTTNNEINKDYYADRYKRVRLFVEKFHSKIFPLCFGSHQIKIDDQLLRIQPKFLDLKTYIFDSKKADNSQYQGLKKYGPYTKLDNLIPTTCFISQPEEKELANELYRALQGKTFATFPGMERFFGYDIKSHVTGVELTDFSIDNIETALDEAISKCNNQKFVAVFISDFEDDANESYNPEYYNAKYVALKKKIPTQFVTSKLLKSKNQLKWSVANIGLQLFAKLGGMPWIVQPSNEKCLIVGLGQAHEKNEDGSIKKFFSYSVLTESSGLYKDIKVLGDSQDLTTYSNSFRHELYELFKNNINEYDKFVVHTPFKMRRDDLEELKKILDGLSKEQSNKEFVALKFNDSNKYFAYSLESNSKVPYESTLLPLSHQEYLIWFEGLQFNNPTVIKRYEKPTHVEFIYPSDKEGLDRINKFSYLQDAINLTGANWRGFNAKSKPVSIYYAQLVAKFYRHFSKIETGQEIDDALEVSSMAPWFL